MYVCTIYKGLVVFFFFYKIFNPKKHYYIHIYVYVREKKKKKKNDSFVSDLLRFSFLCQAVEGVPGRYRGLAGAHMYPCAHVTRPQPDFFAFDGLLTFERYKLPPRR